MRGISFIDNDIAEIEKMDFAVFNEIVRLISLSDTRRCVAIYREIHDSHLLHFNNSSNGFSKKARAYERCGYQVARP